MRLKTFKKGIHPEEFKEETEGKAIESLPLPKEVFIPLQQHIGAPAKAKVSVKEEVQVGQMIGESGGFVSTPVHASISGKVKAIDTFPHPGGTPSQMIHIISDGKDEPLKEENIDWETLSQKELTDSILGAGVVGMGGAAFPTHVKLSPPKEKNIDTFIINGCECEPYLTADHRLMLEFSNEIILGTRIMMKALGLKTGYIGIENNKPDAIRAMKEAVSEVPGLNVVPLKTKYPQGAEKSLIYAVTRRTVPAGGLPMDVGVVVNNVATAIATAEAVIKKKPLIERVVTVTGSGIKEPKNIIARIGTPFQNLIDFCGGLTEDAEQIIMGGPMMGITQYSLKVPIIKATSGILCLENPAVLKEQEFACIKCGQCVNACPLNLLPTKLAALTRNDRIEEAESTGILNCVECGCCAYICPSKIPLVQWMRIGKYKAAENRRKRVQTAG